MFDELVSKIILNRLANKGWIGFMNLSLCSKSLFLEGLQLRNQYINNRIKNLQSWLKVPEWLPLPAGWWGRDMPIKYGRKNDMYSLYEIQPDLPKHEEWYCLKLPMEKSMANYYNISPEIMYINIEPPKNDHDPEKLIRWLKKNEKYLCGRFVNGTACYVKIDPPFHWKGITLVPFYHDQQDCLSWLLAYRDKDANQNQSLHPPLIIGTRGTHNIKDWDPKDAVVVETSIDRFFLRWMIEDNISRNFSIHKDYGQALENFCKLKKIQKLKLK